MKGLGQEASFQLLEYSLLVRVCYLQIFWNIYLQNFQGSYFLRKFVSDKLIQ